MSDGTEGTVNRREFIGAAATASAMIIKPELVWGTEANGLGAPPGGESVDSRVMKLFRKPGASARTAKS